MLLWARLHNPNWNPWEDTEADSCYWNDLLFCTLLSLLNGVHKYLKSYWQYLTWEEGKLKIVLWKIEILGLTWLWQFWRVFYVMIELQRRSILTNTWCKRLFYYMWWHTQLCSTLFIQGPFWKGLMSYIKQAIMWCIRKRGWMWHSSQTVQNLLSGATTYILHIIFASKRIWI